MAYAERFNGITSASGEGSRGNMIPSARMVAGQAAQMSHRARIHLNCKPSSKDNGRLGAYSNNSARVRSAQRAFASWYDNPAPSQSVTSPDGKKGSLNFWWNAAPPHTPGFTRTYGGFSPNARQAPQLAQVARSSAKASSRRASISEGVSDMPGRTMAVASEWASHSFARVNRWLQAAVSGLVRSRVAISAWAMRLRADFRLGAGAILAPFSILSEPTTALLPRPSNATVAGM